MEGSVQGSTSHEKKPVKLPRWCPLCITNGYHRPENCPDRKVS